MSRSAKPQNGRRRFLRDVVRTAGGLAAVGVALGVTTANRTRIWRAVAPARSHKRERLCQCLCALRSVCSGLPLRHLKTGDAGLWSVGGHAIFLSHGIFLAKCVRTFRAPKCAQAVRWIVRLNRSTTRGWGWRYWWTRENCLNFQGLRCDVCYRECPKIDEAITLGAGAQHAYR